MIQLSMNAFWCTQPGLPLILANLFSSCQQIIVAMQGTKKALGDVHTNLREHLDLYGPKFWNQWTPMILFSPWSKAEPNGVRWQAFDGVHRSFGLDSRWVRGTPVTSSSQVAVSIDKSSRTNQVLQIPWQAMQKQVTDAECIVQTFERRSALKWSKKES